MEPIITIYSFKDLFIIFLLLLIYSFLILEYGRKSGIEETRKTIKESTTTKHNNINI